MAAPSQIEGRRDPGPPAGEESVKVELDWLPLPALLVRDGTVVSTNQAYRDIVGLGVEQLNGHSSADVIRRTVHPADLVLVEPPPATLPGAASQGHLWCRVVNQAGREHPVRVEWRTGGDPRDIFVFLIEARPEAYGQSVADALARTAGALSRCATEDEILGRAADSLAEHGFTVTTLLVDEESPLLKYGPQRSAAGLVSVPGADPAWSSFRPTRELLEQINPHFLARRAAFFQDGVRLVHQAYPERIAEELARRLPSTRMVQVPLFVADVPYGAMVVTGDALTPMVATALELFGELVGHALANVRLRKERVDRERLAALGEASAVMAHEVRNPVAAIINAVAIARRASSDDPVQGQMLQVIAEESARLEHLVNQLLEVGRPLAPRPRRVSLEDLIASSLALLGSRKECPPGRVEVLPTSAPTAAELDPDLASLALLNVLRNAIQSTPASGSIRVSIETRDTLGGVIVEDAGPGIPPEILKRLGEPFTTTRATGTGIGLAVVRRVLDASGGRLDVLASGLGGARIELWFRRPELT